MNPAQAQLAQVNLARTRFPLDSAPMREFVAAVDRINRLAERSEGFVWRYATGPARVRADAAGVHRAVPLRCRGPLGRPAGSGTGRQIVVRLTSPSSRTRVTGTS